jgi:fimbrial chaperone protein
MKSKRTEFHAPAARFALWQFLAMAVLACQPALVMAVFDASVSPPRFELQAKPGEVIRQVVTITNGSSDPARYTIKTADWKLDNAGEVQYHEGAPQTGSCRPWVRLERHEIAVGGADSRSYRFEIHVPANAPSGECRFAFLIAGQAGQSSPTGAPFIQLPIVGRLGIVVYVTIGDAKPAVKLEQVSFKRLNGKLLPVATFRNSGTAHSRVFGTLEALDAGKHKLSLTPEPVVLLPGATREITLSPVDWSKGDPVPASFQLSPPMHVRGQLEFLGGGKIKIDQVVR